MKLVTGKSRSGLYAGLWEWLDNYIGHEGQDYIIKTIAAGPGQDRAIVSEIEFVDPNDEILARLTWPFIHNDSGSKNI